MFPEQIMFSNQGTTVLLTKTYNYFCFKIVNKKIGIETLINNVFLNWHINQEICKYLKNLFKTFCIEKFLYAIFI